MSTMIRKQFYIEPRQERLLKRIAKKTGKTEAEIIREAIDRHAEETERAQSRLEAWRAEREFIRQWIAKGPVPAGKRWTRDEIHEW